MTRHLDILIMESQRGTAHAAEAQLIAAGHRVHRCHEAKDRGFPCRGVTTPGSCPLDQRVDDQRIDVALLVRAHVEPRTTPLEDGASCAIRAGVPLVEDGPDLLDPYEPWIAARVGNHDVVEACALAADRSFDPLREAIDDKTARLLAGAGLTAADLRCTVEPRGAGLWIGLEYASETDTRLEQALAVRVLDAIRTMDRTFGEVNVTVTSSLPKDVVDEVHAEGATEPRRPTARPR